MMMMMIYASCGYVVSVGGTTAAATHTAYVLTREALCCVCDK